MMTGNHKMEWVTLLSLLRLLVQLLLLLVVPISKLTAVLVRTQQMSDKTIATSAVNPFRDGMKPQLLNGEDSQGDWDRERAHPLP